MSDFDQLHCTAIRANLLQVFHPRPETTSDAIDTNAMPFRNADVDLPRLFVISITTTRRFNERILPVLASALEIIRCLVEEYL